MTHAAPVASAERIAALDTLRGFAVLGILVMNVQSFSMPLPAYLNPTAYGDLGGANGWVWRLSHLFFDQKFMTIFSLLFGAGIILFTTRAEAKGESPRRLHYRRMLWLLLFGLAHAYALWYGDILVSYALCGMMVYPFRKRSPATLLIVGVALLAFGSALWIFFGWSMPYWPEEEINSLLDKDWQPRPEALAAELGAYRGGWWTQMNHRVPTSFELQTFVFLIGVMWRVSGVMLAGMALFKLGILTAERTRNFFAAMFAAGMFGGVPLVAYGIARNVAAGWDVRYSFFHGSQFNYWGSLLVCAGWIGMVMLAAKSPAMDWFTRPLGAAGRMAFTNYLMQTLICTTIFYGHGFGLFGSVPRTGQALVVVGVWIFQLVFSPLWLRRYQFGPFEWAWRSLTYGAPQPFRRAAFTPASASS
jgi:uncharacterized protein